MRGREQKDRGQQPAPGPAWRAQCVRRCGWRAVPAAEPRWRTAPRGARRRQPGSTRLWAPQMRAAEAGEGSRPGTDTQPGTHSNMALKSLVLRARQRSREGTSCATMPAWRQNERYADAFAGGGTPMSAAPARRRAAHVLDGLLTSAGRPWPTLCARAGQARDACGLPCPMRTAAAPTAAAWLVTDPCVYPTNAHSLRRCAAASPSSCRTPAATLSPPMPAVRCTRSRCVLRARARRGCRRETCEWPLSPASRPLTPAWPASPPAQVTAALPSRGMVTATAGELEDATLWCVVRLLGTPGLGAESQ